MSKSFKLKLAAPIAAGVLALFSTGASAVQVLGYSQIGQTNTATLTANGAQTQTTITSTNVGISVGNYLGGGAPFNAILNLSATSTNAAVVIAGAIFQSYSGSFCITSAAGCGGTNYLSGTFIDDLLGLVGGSSFTLSATTPPGANVTFTSSVLTPLQLLEARAVGFSFSNVLSALALCGTTVCSATASQSGTMSSNIGQSAPEPATLSLIGLALAGLGFARRRKQA